MLRTTRIISGGLLILSAAMFIACGGGGNAKRYASRSAFGVDASMRLDWWRWS
jgi:hypothetical protein